MEILTLTSGYMESHCYLMVAEGHTVIIDPGDAEDVLLALDERQLQADFGILTHEHCDHIFGCGALREKLGIPFYASKVCDQNMRDTRKNFSRFFDAFADIQTKINGEGKRMPQFTASADRTFEGEMTLDWRGHRIQMRETPGHSEGSICVLVDQRELFVGDTLLENDLTGLRYPGSSREEMTKNTIPWLRSLPGGIHAWAGHGPSFSLSARLRKPILEEGKSKGERS